MNTSNTQIQQQGFWRNLRTQINRHPIAAFILFTLAWSWSIWSLLFLTIEPGGLLHNPPPLSFLFVIVGGFGPTLSGLLVTWSVYGADGLQAIKTRLGNWRVGRWWLALLIIPGITAITPLLRWITGYKVDMTAMMGLIIPGLVLGLVAGLMEEFGWRGFLLPQLLKRYAPFTATLLLGFVWGGLWHGYADYFGLGDKGLAFWPLMVLLGPVLLTAWSLIITRVYEMTEGSLLLSILMHASLSSSAFIFGQTYTTLIEEIAWTAISVGIAWMGAVLFWLVTRQSSRRMMTKI
jgi:uncharacterized protein